MGDEARFQTPTVPAGHYRVSITGTGDADLYVRLGDAPSEDLYDCRPYMNGSKEVCEVHLEAPAAIHMLLLGYAGRSEVDLVAELVQP